MGIFNGHLAVPLMTKIRNHNLSAIWLCLRCSFHQCMWKDDYWTICKEIRHTGQLLYRIPPQFGEKIQKTIHPQPMSGQGGYAVVSMQNQGIWWQYRPKTSPFGSLLSGIPKNTLFLSYFLLALMFWMNLDTLYTIQSLKIADFHFCPERNYQTLILDH